MAKRKQGCVLIVDDEPDILLVLEEVLKKDCSRVITANDGYEAIEKVKKHKIDIVLLDIALPKQMDGIETLTRIRKLKPKIIPIMITGYRDANKVVDAFRLGAYDCIFKPFDFKYLSKLLAAKLAE